jgi:Phosphotransferase enzyme family
VQTHPIFKEILLHSDNELAEILGSSVVERRTIHQWPLSCVQKLTLEDGRQLAYKSQLPPSVEGDFYERASSDLLPAHRILGGLGQCRMMTLDWIDAPLLRDAAHSQSDLLGHGERILARISRIRGELPAYLDIGTPEAWSAMAEDALEKLRRLIMDRKFKAIGVSSLGLLKGWTESAELIHLIADSHSSVIHGDLKADQVFVLPDGYRVIDWQRPMVAPGKVDLVSLIVGEGLDPFACVDSISVKLFWFLRLAWAVEAQSNLFPDFRGPLFGQWALTAVQQILR